MRVRAKMTLRNDKMLAARERLGLTQKALAELAEVTLPFVSQLESFDFSAWESAVPEGNADTPGLQVTKLRSVELDQRARRVADVLELDIRDVLPSELRGHKIESSISRVADVDARRLLHLRAMSLPSGCEEVENQAIGTEARRRIAEALATLSYREREVLKLRFGLGDGYTYTLEEVAHVFQVGRERIRQIEAKAIRRLQRPERVKKLKGL